MLRPLSQTFLCQKWEYLLLYGARHASFALADVNVYLAADPELGQINPRLDGITRVRDEVAHIVGFHAIHVDAVAVHTFADAVAGAMKKVFPVAGFVDHHASGVVHLPALQWLARGDAGTDQVNGFIAGLGHDAENFGVLVRDFGAEIADPGHIVIDTALRFFLSPDVEKQQISFAYR